MQSLRGLSSDGTSTTAFELLFSDFEEESHCGFMMIEVQERVWGDVDQCMHLRSIYLRRGFGLPTCVSCDECQLTGREGSNGRLHNHLKRRHSQHKNAL